MFLIITYNKILDFGISPYFFSAYLKQNKNTPEHLLNWVQYLLISFFFITKRTCWM